MNKKHRLPPESPCCNCPKYDCQRCCEIWVKWFTKEWQEIRQAGNKMNGGDPGGS